jgi:hypothetical protein
MPWMYLLFDHGAFGRRKVTVSRTLCLNIK